jgi:hypothetical protein
MGLVSGHCHVSGIQIQGEGGDLKDIFSLKKCLLNWTKTSDLVQTVGIPIY